VSYKLGGQERQYEDSHLLRELHKALVGFSKLRHQAVGQKEIAAPLPGAAIVDLKLHNPFKF
jgi:hypothetical protein